MPSLIRKRIGSRVNRKHRHVKTVSWQVQVPIGATPGGTIEYLRRTFPTQGEAKAFLDSKLEEKRSGGVVKPSEATLGAFLGEWLTATAASRRENTQQVYSDFADRYLKPLLGSRKLADLQPLAIQRAYQDLLNRPLSPRTVRYAHSILHNALDQAVKWRMLSVNPAKGVELPKPKPTRTMRPLDTAEAKRFLDACRARDDEGKPLHRLGVYFELAVDTGMRPSELLALRWRDLDLKARDVKVRHTLVRAKHGGPWLLAEPKTACGKRSIPVMPKTAESLGQWKHRQAEERMKAGDVWRGEHNPAHGFVFTTLTGEPLEIRNLSLRDLVNVAKAAGLAREIPPKTARRKPTYRSLITLYDLRHTCATLMLTAGVNPKVVSERLGHASVVITLNTYSHVLPTMQADATEKLGALLYGGGA